MSSTLEYWVWLGMAFGSANDRTDEIIRQFGGAEQFYREGGARTMERLTQHDRAHLAAVKLDDAKRVAERAQSGGVTVLTPDDARYPQRLRGIWGMPCVLYVDGSLDGIDERLAVAMVGTRRCSDYGFRAAVKIAGELARAGAVVVSGLAIGIDTACHTAAVKEDAPTVAVLGCGIDKTYPAQNETLRELIAKRGAIVTEYAPGTQPQPANFPKRNRIISGLSVGVVVVEAGLHSGSLITANQAAEQGRDVFAVPGDIFRPTSQGTFLLLQQGSAPVSCGADLLEEYRFRFSLTLEPVGAEPADGEQQTELCGAGVPFPAGVPSARAGARQKARAAAKLPAVPEEPTKPVVLTIPEELTGAPRTVFQQLMQGEARAEDVAGALKLPVHAVLAALTELELSGYVRAGSGGRYACSAPENAPV